MHQTSETFGWKHSYCHSQLQGKTYVYCIYSLSYMHVFGLLVEKNCTDTKRNSFPPSHDVLICNLNVLASLPGWKQHFIVHKAHRNTLNGSITEQTDSSIEQSPVPESNPNLTQSLKRNNIWLYLECFVCDDLLSFLPPVEEMSYNILLTIMILFYYILNNFFNI